MFLYPLYHYIYIYIIVLFGQSLPTLMVITGADFSPTRLRPMTKLGKASLGVPCHDGMCPIARAPPAQFYLSGLPRKSP